MGNKHISLIKPNEHEARMLTGISVSDYESAKKAAGNLLKQGIKNVIALNGTSIPETIKILGSKKVLTLFVDGDRGGDLIVRGLIDAGVEIDYVAKAPDGKEVEEITKKEIHKAIRSKVAVEQIKMEISKFVQEDNGRSANMNNRFQPKRQDYQRQEPVRNEVRQEPIRTEQRPVQSVPRQVQTKTSPNENKKFKELLDDLIGTKAAYFLDDKLTILGKVPVTELEATIRNIKAYALVFDGIIERNIALSAERSGIQYMVAMSSKVAPRETRINVLTQKDLS